MLGLKTELEVARELAARVRALRLEFGWSQGELARRAGLRLSTYRLFEQTGQIALVRLLRVLSILDRLNDFEQVCLPSDAPRSLADLHVRKRQRGRRTPHA